MMLNKANMTRIISSKMQLYTHNLTTSLPETLLDANQNKRRRNNTSAPALRSSMSCRGWSLEVLMIVTFSFLVYFTSAPVFCISLRGNLEMKDLASAEVPQTPSQRQQQQESSGSGTGSAIVPDDVGEADGNEESHANYIVQRQSQLLLPSLLPSQEMDDQNSMIIEEEEEERNPKQNSPQQRTYHLQKLKQNPMDEGEGGSGNSNKGQWETVIDPHLYLLTERNQPQLSSLQGEIQQRMRRSGPSLSIVNPLDVLRQRLLLEIARRKMRQNHNQIISNAEILKNIGRR